MTESSHIVSYRIASYRSISYRIERKPDVYSIKRLLARYLATFIALFCPLVESRAPASSRISLWTHFRCTRGLLFRFETGWRKLCWWEPYVWHPWTTWYKSPLSLCMCFDSSLIIDQHTCTRSFKMTCMSESELSAKVCAPSWFSSAHCVSLLLVIFLCQPLRVVVVVFLFYFFQLTRRCKFSLPCLIKMPLVRLHSTLLNLSLALSLEPFTFCPCIFHLDIMHHYYFLLN